MLVTAQGKGIVGFGVIFGSVCLGMILERFWPGALVLGIGVGFVLGGVAIRVMGRRCNAQGIHHTFCEMRMERWAYVFVPLGLLLTWIGLQASGWLPMLH